MAREKATITLDRVKAARAAELLGTSSTSQTVDIALERLIRTEELRRDVATYRERPLSPAERAVDDLEVVLDLGDEDVDYEVLYGGGA